MLLRGLYYRWTKKKITRMISSTFGNEEIQQMTALCSEPFVHYCQAKKERGREIGMWFVSGLQNIYTAHNVEQKRSYNNIHSVRTKWFLKNCQWSWKGCTEGLRCSVFLVRERFGPQCLSAGPIRINDRLFSKIRRFLIIRCVCHSANRMETDREMPP